MNRIFLQAKIHVQQESLRLGQMKRIFFAISVGMLIASLFVTGFVSTRTRAQQRSVTHTDLMNQFVPGRVLVKFHSEIAADHARQIIAALGARDVGEMANIGVHVLDLPYQANETAFVQAFEAQPEVEFAELDRLLPPQQLEPNDPVYAISANSWSLHKIK